MPQSHTLGSFFFSSQTLLPKRRGAASIEPDEVTPFCSIQTATRLSRCRTMSARSQGIISGDRLITHEERESRSRQFAGGLKSLGITRGDCVAILMRNDVAFLEATLGAMMLGAYAVPINWHFKPEEIAYILADCGAKVLIGHSDLLHRLGPAIFSEVRTFWVLTPPRSYLPIESIQPIFCRLRAQPNLSLGSRPRLLISNRRRPLRKA
jgi:hypothetical protein